MYGRQSEACLRHQPQTCKNNANPRGLSGRRFLINPVYANLPEEANRTVMTAEKLAWGIIGPGTIAKTFAAALPHSETGRLAAIATRDPKKPGLAEGFPGVRILDGYAAMLADSEVEA